jgi:hypothetical protein
MDSGGDQKEDVIPADLDGAGVLIVISAGFEKLKWRSQGHPDRSITPQCRHAGGLRGLRGSAL